MLATKARTGPLFLAVIVGHVILISAQVQSKGGVPVLEAVTFGLFAEVQRSASAGVSFFSHAWSSYAGLRGVKAENAALKQQIADLEIQVQQQRALADQSRGLEKLLDLQDSSNLHTIAAEIIGAGATPEFRTVTIDKGSMNGLRSDMAVIAPAGVVGRVAVSSPRAAKVQLLIDRNAAAGAIVERSRAQGVVVGWGDGGLRMEYVSEVSDVEAGDTVMTSGIDGIFPKGFVIGRVETVEKNGTAYKQILVKPAVDFSSLEQVLVVLTSTPVHETGENDAKVGDGSAKDVAQGPKP